MSKERFQYPEHSYSSEPETSTSFLRNQSSRTEHIPYPAPTTQSSEPAETSSSNYSRDESAFSISSCDPHDRTRRTSWVSAFVTFLKALFGVSLLSQPRILGETGLILGTLVHITIIAACVFACYLLLKARSMAAMPPCKSVAVELASLSHDKQPQEEKLASVTESLRKFMSIQTNSSYGTAFGVKGRLITYADLARQLMGSSMSFIVSWIIILLHILFASGMYSGAINNLSAFLGWQAEPGPDSTPEGAARLALTALLFPVAAILLQVSTLKKMFFISAAGLIVYLVGCVGSMIFSAISFARSDEDRGGPDAPNDMWEWKWSGIPVFVASTVYAIEGINLALPTANSLDDQQQQRAVPLLFAAVILYGLLTLAVAWMGYIGGMGGGPGTVHGEDGCRELSYCLYSESVQSTYQLSLSIALLLTLPVILYPSTEMLEIWATERDERRKQQQQQSDDSEYNSYTLEAFGEKWHHPVVGESDSADTNAPASVPETTNAGEPLQKAAEKEVESLDSLSHSRFEQHFIVRFTLAVVVCVFGALEELISTQMNFVRGIGLSFAGFLLPPILYIKARERVGVPLLRKNGKMIMALILLLCFGVFNMVLVCLSAFTEQDLGP